MATPANSPVLYCLFDAFGLVGAGAALEVDAVLGVDAEPDRLEEVDVVLIVVVGEADSVLLLAVALEVSAAVTCSEVTVTLKELLPR